MNFIDHILLVVSLVINVYLLILCLVSINNMTHQTSHLSRTAVILIASGAVFNLITSHPGASCWLAPLGMLLYLVAERRGYMPRLTNRLEEHRNGKHIS